MGLASGWNLWVWLECIGVASRCCCKEVYRFPHNITYPTPLILYGVPFVSKLKMMLVFTIHAGIYDSCWYLRSMLVFTLHAGTVNTSTKCKYQHES